MAHKALYRQFRPITFNDVIGQESIVNTIRNQIQSDTVGHAYLFTGSRGTGKTTSAKVLSRAVNCTNRLDHNPCNLCEACLSVLSESSMDVIELDAASHNGVDDIRELRENVKFPPSQLKYKVMIIDEVHMLSKGAFNALLKTLEEPPAYMIFILATTEPNKVPATITSRCQRFEFKRIDFTAILAYLQKLCAILNVTVEDDALKLIIRLSEGAMRDALSLLEQCLSFSGDILRYEEACKILGKSNEDDIAHLSKALLDRDGKSIVDQCRLQYNSGKEAVLLLMDLIDSIRCGLHEAMDTGASKPYTSRDWLFVLDHLIDCESKVKYASQPWIALEVALLKIALYESPAIVVQAPSKAFAQKSEPPQGVKQPMARSNEVQNRTPSSQAPVEKQDAVFVATPEMSQQLGTLELGQIIQNWDQYLLAIKKRLVSTYALMKEVKPISYGDGILKLYLNESLRILKPAIENADNSQHTQSAFIEIFGCCPKFVIIDELEMNSHADEVKRFFNGLVDEDMITIK